MAGDMARERVMHAVLERQVEKYGNRTFLYFNDQEFGFKDLDDAASRVASGLQRLGIAKGDKVAIVMDNCEEFVFLMYGLSKLGAIQVPINTAHKGDILTYMLDHSDSRIVVAHHHYLDRIRPVLENTPKIQTLVVLEKSEGDPPGASDLEVRSKQEVEKQGWRTIYWDELVDNDGRYEPVEVLFSDPVAIMYTSGTTGLSKGVLTPHNQPLSVSERICAGVLSDQDCIYSVLPLFHNGGQSTGISSALLSGARVVVGERFSASGFWDDVKRYHCTVLSYIGSMLPMLFKAEPRPDDADNPLRVGLGGGAPRDIFQAFEKRFGITLLEFYGQSEIGVPLVSDLANRKPGACGKVHSDYVAKVVDDKGFEVGSDTPGELLIRPVKPYIIGLEYYKAPEKTVEVWRDLWYRTGEYLTFDKDRFFYFLDRKKDALRRRGENISSFEVEKVINSHSAVLESAAIGVKSGMGVGEDEVMVCLTLKPGQKLEPLDLIKHCEERMAYFMVPRYLRLMETMPKTASMRIEKYKLRQEGITPDTWDREATGYKLQR